MVELFSLVKGLNEEDIRYLTNSLRRHELGEDEVFLMQKLFVLIVECENDEDQFLLQKIYRNNNTQAFAKLKSRLFQFILDSLATDQFLKREYLLDPVDRQIIKLRKKMLQFRILYKKKEKIDIKVLYHLLSEILKAAKEFEQYDVLIEALYFKKYITMLRKGFEEVKEIQEQIKFYEYTQRAVIMANDYYFELITNQSMVQKENAENVRIKLKSILNELRLYIGQTNSDTINYIYKLISLEELILTKKHKDALNACLDILSLTEKSPVLKTGERKGFIYDNLSLCLVLNGDYKSARVHAQKAQTFYSGKSINYLFSMQQEFYSCFYDKNYTDALVIIESMLMFEVLNKGEFRHDKYKFLKACTLLKLSRTKDALSICNSVLEISKDKGRWDLGMRYIKLKCLFLLEEFDTAANSLEALRKVLNRTRGIDTNHGIIRDELIYKAFKELVKVCVNSTSVNKLNNILDQLSERSCEHSWNYYSHEVLPVHTWIGTFLETKSLQNA